MSRTSVWVIIIVIVIVVLGLLWWIFSAYSGSQSTTLNSPSESQTADSVKITSTGALGSFLADANGRTLYYFANDVSGKSNCTGNCLSSWPPFYVSNVQVSGDLNSSDFGSISTASSSSQTTFKGWPLYYYAGDKNPGDTNGQGLQDKWFVVPSPFYNIMLLNNQAARLYLADSNGLALYYYKSDTQGTVSTNPKSNCTGNCLNTWAPFDQSKPIFPALLKATDFKEFTREDGQTQLSYKGWPLYLFSGDTTSGNTNGDGKDNKWYLVKP